MYNDVVEESGYDKSTLATYKSISQSVEPLRRLKDLSFEHHLQVASLLTFSKVFIYVGFGRHLTNGNHGNNK